MSALLLQLSLLLQPPLLLLQLLLLALLMMMLLWLVLRWRPSVGAAVNPQGSWWQGAVRGPERSCVCLADVGAVDTYSCDHCKGRPHTA